MNLSKEYLKYFESSEGIRQYKQLRKIFDHHKRCTEVISTRIVAGKHHPGLFHYLDVISHSLGFDLLYAGSFLLWLILFIYLLLR